MRIAVIGTGYVGLVTGACFADHGHTVIGVDREREKIQRLNRGEVTIYEVGLPDLLARNLGRTLSFTTDTDEAVSASEIVFITVGTPQGEEGEADMSYVVEAASGIAAAINAYKIIVNKSTMPVGSTRLVDRVIREKAEGEEFDVISNPEFLREGTAVRDFMNPDRIVIGTGSQKAAGIMAELYRPLNAPLFITDPASAEMIKYASNAFLATKVSFINAIANICEATGADVKEVAMGMGYDHRIGFEFLRSGPGFGGSCFPKDCQALIEIARNSGYHFHLLEGVMQVNQEQIKLTAGKVERRLGGLEGRQVAAWGLAFKPNTDDVRDSPALEIISLLSAGGARVLAYDPQAMENARASLPGLECAGSALEAATGADILLILTDWDEFKMQDFRKVAEAMKGCDVLDARNCLDPLALRRLGFNYEGIGR
ncbi:MAG: UDP-glucose/GDP-mannose dehydrogenase family protein [Actinomycetota bacterium]|nr:UDP-glucose/GDP-mannose dehydrogenase family protein [Actinomycetota bacterium]MDD5668033.1 UDP-glucose/GDP-mannose dehydrogenase family protein [Actinomycetota bacterium]